MFVRKIKNQWLDSFWLQTRKSFRGQTDFCETLFKTTLSSPVRKNSLRFAIDIDDFEENISAFNLMPEKSLWHIVSRIVLWAIVIMTTKVLGLINFVHFIMKVQLHLQFANLKIWNFQWACILIAAPRLLSFHSDVVSDFFPFHCCRYDTEKPPIPTSHRWNIAGLLILPMSHMINWHLTSSNSTWSFFGTIGSGTVCWWLPKV